MTFNFHSLNATRAILSTTLAAGMILSAITIGRADPVYLGCDPDSCGPVHIPPCSGCGDHTIGVNGGAGAPGNPINTSDD